MSPIFKPSCTQSIEKRLFLVKVLGIGLGFVFSLPSTPEVWAAAPDQHTGKGSAKVETPSLAPVENEPKQPAVTLKGDVHSFGVLTEDVQSSLGLECGTDGSGNARINKVRLTSLAARGGLREGDIVLDVKQKPEVLSITIKRDGKIYAANFSKNPTNPSNPFQEQNAKMDNSGGNPSFRLRIDRDHPFGLNASQVATLSRYNVELIIDRSLSMRQRDCPGDLSRWEWCGRQASAIAAALAPYCPYGQTITRFAGVYDTHEHSTPAQVAQLIATPDFQLGTRLAEPLADRMNRYFTYSRPGDKPLLIAVITDGCPAPRPEPRQVVQTLIEASQRMRSANDVTVVFLQIGGNDPRGQTYLSGLATSLVDLGARYQFVHTATFDQVQSAGLAQSLVDCINGMRPNPTHHAVAGLPGFGMMGPGPGGGMMGGGFSGMRHSHQGLRGALF